MSKSLATRPAPEPSTFTASNLTDQRRLSLARTRERMELQLSAAEAIVEALAPLSDDEANKVLDLMIR